MEEVYIFISNKIKEARKSQGLTLDEISENRVSWSFFAKVETGKEYPPQNPFRDLKRTKKTAEKPQAG